jgi:hypothetical protein
VPDEPAQQVLLRRTLPDVQLQVAQECSPKARHGRRETRTLWALHSPLLNAYLGSAGTVGAPWPGVAQVCRLQRVVWRRERPLGAWQPTAEVAYAITSWGPAQATARALLQRWRVHWHIENRLHWVRDVTLGEDASQIHTEQAPLVFATLRNAARTLLPWLGRPSVAAAQREVATAPGGVLTLFATLAAALRTRPAASTEQEGGGRLALRQPPPVPGHPTARLPNPRDSP